ncbi:hypothetical protein MRX96_041632 [Rhipicephalus microplus]
MSTASSPPSSSSLIILFTTSYALRGFLLCKTKKSCDVASGGCSSAEDERENGRKEARREGSPGRKLGTSNVPRTNASTRVLSHIRDASPHSGSTRLAPPARKASLRFLVVAASRVKEEAPGADGRSGCAGLRIPRSVSSEIRGGCDAPWEHAEQQRTSGTEIARSLTPWRGARTRGGRPSCCRGRNDGALDYDDDDVSWSCCRNGNANGPVDLVSPPAILLGRRRRMFRRRRGVRKTRQRLPGAGCCDGPFRDVLGDMV